MGILSSLFGLNSKEEEKPAVVKVFTKSVVEPTIKESLANLAIKVIGASERTALIPLKEDNISAKYSELVKLGLKNSANAKVLKKQLDNINYYNSTILKAQELLKYLKDINNLLGNSVILVNTSTFYELCHKYGLFVSFLQDFTGVIPAQNLNELIDINNKLHTNNASELRINYQTVRVDKISNYSEKSDSYIKERLEYYFNILQIPKYTFGKVRLKDAKDFIKERWVHNVYIDVNYATSEDFFIACPKSYLKERPIIASKPIDPIIFQYCPYGVLIYTMWGDEAEDKVFEEYKKLNNLV
jgi:hypothetical protein|nr:MAG TPA: hypothetical protein [Caudoviricetes sp.]